MLWQLVSSKAPLHGNPIVCWKFLHVLHKVTCTFQGPVCHTRTTQVIREGHPNCVKEAGKHRGLIEDLGKLWGHLKEGFGMLISLYCKLLVVKLDFHQRTPEFPGNLAVDKETLIKIGNNDAGQFYELCIEFLDYMDEILALEKGVFSSLDMSKANSMTMGGQCRLAPLIVCIQDSVHLYDYTVKLLFLLHQHLPPDTLAGHAQRFLAQFERLRKFYIQCSNLQYFKHLVQVPSLPANPPNFAVISELSRHVTPVAVVAAVPEEEAEEIVEMPEPPPLADERERYIDQLIGELEAAQQRLAREEDARASLEQRLHLTEERVREQEAMVERLKAEVETNLSTIAALTGMVEEAQAVQGGKEEKNKSLEDKFLKLKEVYQKLREEHITLLRQKAEVDKRASAAEIGKTEAVRAREAVEGRVEEMLTQLAAVRSQAEEGEQEVKERLHNLQASNASMQSKLQQGEEEKKEREESLTLLQEKLAKAEMEVAAVKTSMEEGRQNKSNLEMEMVEVTSKLKEAEVVRKGQEEMINELKCQVENKEELLTAKNSALRDLASEKEEWKRREEQAGVNMVTHLQAIEESESVTVSCYSLLHLVRGLQEEETDWSSPRQVGHNASLVWLLTRGAANTCPDTDLAQAVEHQAENVLSNCKAMMTVGEVGRGDVRASLAKLEELANKVLVSLGQEVDLGDLVAQEMQVMDQQIEEAAARIEQLLEESRRKHTGAQLEVNSKVLDSCTELVGAIRELVMRSKALQREIVEERGLAQGQTDKEFYRKNR